MVTIPPPEVLFTDHRRVHCDGDADGVPGHPRIYLQIDASGYADCSYCDRRFILAGGPAETRPGIAPASDDGGH